MNRSDAGSGSPRTGIWLFPDAPVDELVDAVVAAEAAGVDEIWIADEGVMREPVVVLSAAAVRTERIRLGVGITSVALRHPGAVASSMATLDELSNGRAVLGLGVGGELSLAPFGLHVERPIAAMRDAIRTARAVLDRVPADGYDVPGHAAPARSVPVYVGSHGEQINRLASIEADGVFLSGFPPSRLGEVIGWSRTSRPIDVALYQSVRFGDAVSDDPTAVTGTPAHVAAVLGDLVEEHAPASVGLALVDGDPLSIMMPRALETIARYRASTAR